MVSKTTEGSYPQNTSRGRHTIAGEGEVGRRKGRRRRRRKRRRREKKGGRKEMIWHI